MERKREGGRERGREGGRKEERNKMGGRGISSINFESYRQI